MFKVGFRIGRRWIKIQPTRAPRTFSERYPERTGVIVKILGPLCLIIGQPMPVGFGVKWFKIGRAEQ